MDNHYFGIVDFILFGGLLLLSALIGVYSAFKSKEEQSTENYYFGNRRMPAIPTGLSMGVSFISAITVIGAPVESYLFGAVLSWMVIGYLFGLILTAMYFVPFVYRLNISSIYEYLEMRFDRKVRLFCSTLTILQMVFYMGVCVYLPALALNAVTPLDMKWTIILTSLVCTFYTSLGGFKAVVWTDTLQAVIMFVGSIALCVQGTNLVGGPSNVWNAAVRGERLNLLQLSFDPTVRISAVHCVVGQIFMLLSITWSNQAMVQRIISCKSTTVAKRAIAVSFGPTALLSFLAVANGLVMYAYYENCDPLISRQISKPDQMIPYMMTEAFLTMPGLAGIFVAAACSGTLSTVSSGINSLSVIITEDFGSLLKTPATARQKLWGGRLCGAFIGCLVTVIAFIAGNIGTTVLQIAASLIGAFGGPIFGVFILGIFIPISTTKGALAGASVSTALNFWMITGTAIYKTNPAKMHILDRSITNCSSEILQHSEMNTTTGAASLLNVTEGISPIHYDRSPIADSFYSISYMYVCLFGILTSVTVGVIVSLVTGRRDPKEVDPILFLPLISNEVFPVSVRRFFRFGVPEMNELLHNENFEMNGTKSLDFELQKEKLCADNAA